MSRAATTPVLLILLLVFGCSSSPDDAETQISSPISGASVVRNIDRSTYAPGERVEVRLLGTDISQFYAVQENFEGLELISHTADNRRDGTFVMLTPGGFSYLLAVPADAQSGQTFGISGEFWENPNSRFRVSPETSEIRIE